MYSSIAWALVLRKITFSKIHIQVDDLLEIVYTDTNVWMGSQSLLAHANEDERRVSEGNLVRMQDDMTKDREILKLLEQDSRMPAERIAAMVGEDVDKVRDRIREWENAGIIRRYKTVIDWERFGVERVFAFIDVSVTPERGAGFDDIARRIYRYPEVHSVYLVSGGHDLRVVVEGDSMKQVANFVAEKLATIDRVNSTNTHFLLKKYKDDGDLFVETDADHRLMVTP